MIEDNFKPQTVNEVLLLERIRELRRTVYECGDPYRVSVAPEFDKPIFVSGIHSTLHLAASLKAGWENDARFGVTAQTHGRDMNMEMGYYLSRETLTTWTDEAAANHLGEMHRVMIKSLAGVLRNRK